MHFNISEINIHSNKSYLNLFTADIISRGPLKVILCLPEKVPSMLRTVVPLPISNLTKPAPPKKQKATTTATGWAACPFVLRLDWWTPLAVAAEVQSPSCSVKTQVRTSRLFPRVGSSAAETTIKGGVMPLDTSLGKVLQATVVAVGSGPKGWRASTS